MSKSLDNISRFYQKVLFESPLGESALSYLRERGFTDDTIRDFEVGFSPAKRIDYVALGALSYTDLSNLEELSHVFKNKNGAYADKFSGRVTFPLKNNANSTLGFAARVLDDSLPKYLNSSESEQYHKARTLYGLQLASQHIYDNNYAILCEGYTDAMAFHQVGKNMAVACGGTHATDRQLALIGRYTKNIFLAFDADGAGDQVTDQTTTVAKSMGLNIAYLATERGKDPAEVLLSK